MRTPLTTCTGFKISVGHHWPAVIQFCSNEIVYLWTLTDAVNCREEKVWGHFLIFGYLKNFVNFFSLVPFST